MSDRKRRVWPWIIGAVIALPFVYFLVVIPVCFVLVKSFHVTPRDSTWVGVTDVIYYPSDMQLLHGPESCVT